MNSSIVDDEDYKYLLSLANGEDTAPAKCDADKQPAAVNGSTAQPIAPLPGKLQQYFQLFERVFKEIKTDILSGDLMVREDGQEPWSSPFSKEHLESLKTFADEQSLDRSSVTSYLYRYKKDLKRRSKPELLLDIPAWDGTDFIAAFASRVHSPVLSHQQIEEILKEWFARIFQRLHNSKVDNTCLILVGKQGIGKDVFIRAITSGFDQFFIPFQYQGQQKDILHALHSGAVVHIEEFDHIADKLPEGFLKMLITTSQTLFRPAYGKAQQLKEAKWSLIASCNRDDFLRDYTGNRRFVIIPVDKIDGVLSNDRRPRHYPDGLINYPATEGLKLLAQAKVLAEQQYMASTETKAAIAAYVAKLTPINPEREFLADFLEYVRQQPNPPMVKGCVFLSTSVHEKHILELARRYKLRQGWSGVKSILAKNGVDTEARRPNERGLGVPPEMLPTDRKASNQIEPTFTELPIISAVNGNGHK